MLVRKMFHTGVTRSMTCVAMAAGNQCRREDEVMRTSLRRPGSAAHCSVQDSTEMKAAGHSMGSQST